MAEPAGFERATLRAGEISAPSAGRLVIDGTPIRVATPPAVRALDLHVIEPGAPVRITGLLDAVHPAVRPKDPDTTFPGFTGGPAPGSGIRVLDGVTVLASADLRSCRGFDQLPDRPDGDSIVDMAGPGAAYVPWTAGPVVVLEFEPDPAAPVADVDHFIRQTTLRTARDLAAAADEAGPAERLPVPDLDPGLPPVAVILQIGSEGPLLDTYLDGRALRGSPPLAIDPFAVLGGGLVSGAFDWAALRDTTASYQTCRLLLRLLRGEGARCAGVVLTRAYSLSYEEKQSMAVGAAGLAAATGAAGAVVTTFQSGNSHTDTMLTIEACESRGLLTAGLIAESDDGLTDHLAAADCLVSTGNEHDLVPAWRPERIIGPEPGEPGAPVPLLSYLGALGQLGNGTLQTVPT
jgi:glycine reductase